jgi:hypothetical protein
MLIARTEAVATSGAMTIGTLELLRTEHILELFGPASSEVRCTAAAARDCRARFLGSVGAQRLFSRSGREADRTNCCSR